MSILDDVGKMAAQDPGAMRRRLTEFPDQLRDARRTADSVELTTRGEGITAIVALAMGGSAIGGELAAGYLSDTLSVPFSVVRNYSLPAYVGSDTLVLVSSYSGNTEETLSAYDEATERGARIVCSTTGGEVRRRAKERGDDIVLVPEGYPPRAALGYGLVPILVLLGRMGLVPDPSEELEDAFVAADAAVERFGLDFPAERNEAKQLAEWLHGHIPVVYGTAPATSVVATRWCCQFAENSEVVAHRNELPEMNHNEIVGWDGDRPLAGRGRVVFLRDESDHPRVTRRIDLTREAIERSGGTVREAVGFGRTRLARLISLIQLGDFASFYLAMLGGVDPTPVRPIDLLKGALADS